MFKINPVYAAAGNEKGATGKSATVPAGAVPPADNSKTPFISPISKAGAIPMPTKRAGGRGSSKLYPFDDLTEVLMSFGVKDKTAKSFASTVTSANKRAIVQAKNPDGSPMTRTIAPTVPGAAATIEKVMVREKQFRVFDVDPATDKDGCSIRVFRIEPEPITA